MRNIHTRLIMAAGLLAGSLLMGQSVFAGLLTYEGFTGLTANTSLNGQGAGTGWSGNWSSPATGIDVVASGLNYSAGDITIDGGDRSVAMDLRAAGATSNIYGMTRSLSDTLGYGTYYLSFLITTTSFADYESDLAIVGLDNDTNGGSYIGGGPGRHQAYARVDGNYTSGSTFSNDVTHLVVVKMVNDATAGAWIESSIYLDPTSASAEPAAATVTEDRFTWDADCDTFVVLCRAYGGTPNPSESFVIDEIRLGTTWVDVVAAPEPVTLALLAIGSIVLAGPRRKHHVFT